MALLILATELLKLPVAAMNIESRIGRIHDVLIDIETGTFEGVMVSLDVLSKPKFLSSQDIISIDPQGVVVKHHGNVVDVDDVVRATKILSQKIRLIGMGVKTQSGKHLGRVTDLVISLQTNKIIKFYVGSLLQDRVIPWLNVIKIERKVMIVEDDIEEAKVAAQAAVGEP